MKSGGIIGGWPKKQMVNGRVPRFPGRATPFAQKYNLGSH